uniref:UBX domain-containing protein n=1 Tax=Denticeps clupeoides TaxID=299321 RepID=A0AAY4E2I4_9TELE
MPLSRSSVTLCILSLSFLCFVSWKHSRLINSVKKKKKKYHATIDVRRVVFPLQVRFHEESVVKPRKESLQRRKEKRFYRMTGEVWKLTQGQKLGVNEEQSASQRAARRRKLPETVSPMPVKRDPPQSKRVIILPEEPQANTEGVVKVALRCPSGRTVYRRFLKCHTSTVLLDWMLKTGYHPMIYTVCMSYPRKPLETGPLMTLEDVGIVRDTVLNVEEKDQSTT